MTGLPPGPADAESLFAMLPPGLTYEAKRTYGVMLGDVMVGCADLLSGWPEVDAVRAAVVRTNVEVLPFWTRQGFGPTGEVLPYRYANLVSETLVLSKELSTAAGNARL